VVDYFFYPVALPVSAFDRTNGLLERFV